MKLLAIMICILGLITIGIGVILAQGEVGTGIASEITNVTIGDDGVPVVTFTLSDAGGRPLSLDAVENVRFLIARVEQDSETALTQYVNYFTREVTGAEYTFQGQTLQPILASVTQPTFEAGEGQFAEVETGVYTYTFGQALSRKR